MAIKIKDLGAYLCWFFILFLNLDANSKTCNFSDYSHSLDTIVPKVFIKAQNERLEDLLIQQFPKQFLYAFDDNAQNAFASWANMIWEMEKFGIQTGYDVRGIKAFATFYYDKKGNIRHIAYSLKGNSKYFKSEELDKFFRQFMAYYRLQKVNPNNKFNFQHEFTLFLPYPRL